MKILFITSRIPYPPFRGDKLRTYNFIRTLSEKNEISLVTFCESQNNYESLRELGKFCKNIYPVFVPKWLSWIKVITMYFSSSPSQVSYYSSFRMVRNLKEVIKKNEFDVVYIHLFRMFQYFPLVSRASYTILDLTDVISKEMFRSIRLQSWWKVFLRRREAKKIRRYEAIISETPNEIWVISEEEKKDLSCVSSSKNIIVVPNGITINKIDRDYKQDRVLFFGYSNAGHNKDALLFLQTEIMPKIKKDVPSVELVVFGAGEGYRWKNKKNEFPINNLGFLPDISNVFKDGAVVVAPILYSAGTQNKILDAMSFGLPVVTSDFGNEGIQAEHLSQIVVCSTPEEYASAVVRLLKDKEWNRMIGSNGQDFVHNKFSWNYVVKRVDEIEKTLKTQNLKPK